MADETTMPETGLSNDEFSDLARRFAAVAPLLQALFPGKSREGEAAGGGTTVPVGGGSGAETPPGEALPVGGGFGAGKSPGDSPPVGGGFGGGKPPGDSLPVGGGFGGGFASRGPFQKKSPRENLLIALKPYLSPGRREMADYLIRLCRVFDAFRGIF